LAKNLNEVKLLKMLCPPWINLSKIFAVILPDKSLQSLDRVDPQQWLYIFGRLVSSYAVFFGYLNKL
jgi:hypothetical protein